MPPTTMMDNRPCMTHPRITTVVHAAIRSLPLFPYLDVEVVPLAAHPFDPERPGGA